MEKELIEITIDDQSVQVPAGTNLIEAARIAGIDIPHYCYHPHLSVPGNCRMCQVEVEGAPKLQIGCATPVREGMVVRTHQTSKEVENAQAATLEFILINHPLDCTVCDQAGHCKLQDYHYEYNARPSRFVENKVNKPKAKPLGSTVMLDAERCIMCTRCIRFCDEVTKTSELGMINRGDRSEITIHPDRPLENALSGTVVDLCPVGALTHREWRFNTRIWFTKETDSICPGCSTGCNVKVAERDGEIVQVKARLNDAVNKEWMCDEGRYGFDRFLPKNRVLTTIEGGAGGSVESALKKIAAIKNTPGLVVFLSPDLLLEEYAIVAAFLETISGEKTVACAYRSRSLSPEEAVLVSPDYAANFRGAEFLGLVNDQPENAYENALKQVREGNAQAVCIVGDRGVLEGDCDRALMDGCSDASLSVGIFTNSDHPLLSSVQTVLPGRSILEKSGLLVNGNKRLQYTDRVIDSPEGTFADGDILQAFMEGASIIKDGSDRDRTRQFLGSQPWGSDLSIAKIKRGGVEL